MIQRDDSPPPGPPGVRKAPPNSTTRRSAVASGERERSVRSNAEGEERSAAPKDPPSSDSEGDATLPGAPPFESEAPAEDDDFAEEEDPLLGTTLGDRYEVERAIGEGGMGRVYLARHQVIDKPCAIKVLHAELAKNKQSVGRFVREARTASSIGNPHIVDVSDFGEVDGRTYFVMEYLEGVTLGDIREPDHPLATELVLKLALQLTRGLAAAHEQGIVHRDLKPDNVMLVRQGDEDHFVKILDFGIAKVTTGGHQTQLTLAGTVFGTPHYMAPEQAAGATVDQRADIYALGVLLYEMASGQLPFAAANFMGILTQHLYRSPTPIRSLEGGRDCPEALEAVILKCLAKKPDARYDDMEALAADLERVRDGERPKALTEAPDASPSNPELPFASGPEPRHPSEKPAIGLRHASLRTGLLAAAVVGLTVGAGAFLFIRDRGAEPAHAASAATPTSSEAPREEAASDEDPVEAVGTADEKAATVLLHSPVASAVATVRGQALALPTNVEIRSDESLDVVVQAPGHRPQTITLTATEPRVLVALRPLRTAKPAPKKPPKKPVDGVVEPWPND